MNVIMLSPGYPAEMPLFTRALAEVGATVIGVGDQPESALPPLARRSLAAYIQVRSLFDEVGTLAEVVRRVGHLLIHRVECPWEPGVVLAARLREALGASGLSVEATLRFRDKELMKQAVDAAGLRTPRHVRARTVAEIWEAAEAIGFPIIVKPIDGAGSADTYRVASADELKLVIPRLGHVPQVSVEEFVDGEEYTYDTICTNGAVRYENVAWYRPRPLIARSNEWVSPQVVALRDVGAPELRGGIELGRNVLKALGFESGFTHMEWYRKADGEVVFGEIGCRPPGARQVDQMNFACDIDTFRGWASAVCYGTFEEDVQRKYNVATIFKRAHGRGIIHRIDGLESILGRFGQHVVANEILPIGAHRRDWLQTLLSDGYIILRHPSLPATLAMADAVGTDLQMYAG